MSSKNSKKVMLVLGGLVLLSLCGLLWVSLGSDSDNPPGDDPEAAAEPGHQGRSPGVPAAREHAGRPAHESRASSSSGGAVQPAPGSGQPRPAAVPAAAAGKSPATTPAPSSPAASPTAASPAAPATKSPAPPTAGADKPAPPPAATPGTRAERLKNVAARITRQLAEARRSGSGSKQHVEMLEQELKEVNEAIDGKQPNLDKTPPSKEKSP